MTLARAIFEAAFIAAVTLAAVAPLVEIPA